MLFNSIEFLIFIVVFMLGYFSSRGRVRLWWMLIASLVFYGWWGWTQSGTLNFYDWAGWKYLVLMIAVVMGNYALALLIDRNEDSARRKYYLTVACAMNLGVLCFFKYFDFFAQSVQAGLGRLGFEVSDHTLGILLPVGISFYIFHAMSYTIDVYRREINADRDPVRVLAFVAFFPQLVAGPIVRGTELLPQMRSDRRPTWEGIQSGMGLVLVGFFKKVVVADSCGPIVTNIFDNPGQFTSLNLLIGVYMYAIQIYCDFSGYTDIAIGIARMLGFVLPQNFNKPYFSASFSEFWTRWHMTLSRWLRDYLYIPLGGNRRGSWITYRNLFITMLLGGLWHGASWTFVFWGFLHGMYLMLQRVLGGPFMKLMHVLHLPGWLVRLFLVLLVFHLTCLAWVFFRAPTIEHAWVYLSRIADPAGWQSFGLLKIQETARAVGLCGLLITCELLTVRYPVEEYLRQRPWLRMGVGAAIIVACMLLGNFMGQQFIYFQF